MTKMMVLLMRRKNKSLRMPRREMLLNYPLRTFKTYLFLVSCKAKILTKRKE